MRQRPTSSAITAPPTPCTPALSSSAWRSSSPGAAFLSTLSPTLERPKSPLIDTLHQRDRRVANLGQMPMSERMAHRGHVTRELATLVEDYISKDVGERGR